jgi:hypothetical protein
MKKGKEVTSDGAVPPEHDWPRNFVPILLCALGVCAVNLAGCGIRPKPPMAGMTASKVVASPFAPKTLELHPLTRVERDGSGKPLIVCHIELHDEWGDTCKATGQLQVQLYRPVGGRQSGLGTQELAWDVDLSDLEMQRLFDSATRTYRLELEGAPEWVLPAGGAKGDPHGRLRAVLTSTGPQGETRTLSSEYSLGQ